MQFSGEEFQSDDGINNDDKDDEKSNVKEWDHGFQNGIQHHLQTYKKTRNVITLRVERIRETLWIGRLLKWLE